MFVGHFAVGFAAKVLAPRLPLAWLVVCAQLADVLWPVFLLVGLEHARIVPGITAASPLDLYDYPFSHSAVALVFWAAVAGAPWLYRRRFRDAAVVFAAVFSHFVLDVVSHRPDVPLAPGSSVMFGLGLWNSRLMSLIVEGGIWAAALTWYVRATRPSSSFGRYGLWVLVALLTLAWVSAMYGPPPPSIRAVALSGLLVTAVLVAWLSLLDARRPSRRAPQT